MGISYFTARRSSEQSERKPDAATDRFDARLEALSRTSRRPVQGRKSPFTLVEDEPAPDSD